jgi:hypothetical protein
MILFTTSDWPSIYGWKAVLMRSVMPASLKRSCHTLPVNTGSRSLTIDVGNPCNRTMPSKKVRVTDAAVYGCSRGMKWAYLENRSTTVRMTDLPPTLGSPSMKSIEMSAQTWDGTSRCCSSPPVTWPASCCAGTWCNSAPNPLPGHGRQGCRTPSGADARSSECPHGRCHAPAGGPGDGGCQSQAQRRGRRGAGGPNPRAKVPVAPPCGGAHGEGWRRERRPLPDESRRGR